MQDVIIRSADGKPTPITACPDAPQTATCPECGAEVHLRKRRRMDGTTTYFYRRTTDEGKDFPRRYRPT